MRRLFLLGATTLILALPLSASAQFEDPWNLDGPRKPSGWVLGLGAGYAIPGGDWVEGVPFSHLVQGVIPLQAELDYRISPSWAFGGFFSYGFGRLEGSLADACEEQGVKCRARPMRAGIQLTYSANPSSRSASAWLGLGAGFEWLRLIEDAGTTTLRGAELSAQLGLDFPSGSGRWGPYLAATMGRYDHVSAETDAGEEGSGEIPSEVQTSHNYLSVGLRMLFDL